MAQPAITRRPGHWSSASRQSSCAIAYEQVAATMRTDCTFRLGWLPIALVLAVPAVPDADAPVEDAPGWSVDGLVEPVVPVLLLDPDFIELSTVPETSTLCPT